MSQPVNPYVAGAPLCGERGFFGWKDTLDWVARELRNPATNALVIFGQRRIGKTTLLLQLERTLPADAFLPVYFDLQDQAAHPLGQMAEAELPEAAAAKAFFPFLRRTMTEDSRPAFVFVVGRRAEDLSLDFTSTFKAFSGLSGVQRFGGIEPLKPLRGADDAGRRCLQRPQRSSAHSAVRMATTSCDWRGMR